MSNEKKKPIVLWQSPLIEIIEDEIYIDDWLIWKDGKLVDTSEARKRGY